MIKVEPQVYLLAETKLNFTGVRDWLTDLGVSHPGSLVLDQMSGSDGEKLIELAGRRCYKSFEVGLNPNVTRVRTSSQEYHENLLRSEHGSVLEHASFTLAFEFVSRVFTHELVRHRAGAAYSQESLRYVRLTELGFWMPPEIANNPAAAKRFEEAVVYLEKAQKDLESIFESELQKEFATKKKLTSAFRRIAPEGLATGIVATFNLRAFRHIAAMRTNPAAEEEIRLAIGKACDIVVTRFPLLFQDFNVSPVDGHDEWSPKHRKI